MPVRFVWNGDAVLKEIRECLAVRVAEAAEILADQVRQEVPVRTGRLRDSIQVEPVAVQGDVISARVVVGADYAAAVEDGTVRVAPNAFMVRALVGSTGDVARALGAK